MVDLKKKEKKPVMKSFADMEEGEFFQIEGDLFMKASETDTFRFTNRSHRSFCLSSGKRYPVCDVTVEWSVKEMEA